MDKWINIVIGVLIFGFVINYFYRLPKFNPGNAAPDFEVELLSGDNFHLSQLKGSYVLLDFWGSWCGPCRKENPDLVKLYRELQAKSDGNKPIVFVSIGIESDVEQWKRAIQRDGLEWPYQIAQLDKFSSPIATLYGVKEIPTKYIIDPDGKIIATNPSIVEMRKIFGLE